MGLLTSSLRQSLNIISLITNYMKCVKRKQQKATLKFEYDHTEIEHTGPNTTVTCKPAGRTHVTIDETLARSFFSPTFLSLTYSRTEQIKSRNYYINVYTLQLKMMLGKARTLHRLVNLSPLK